LGPVPRAQEAATCFVRDRVTRSIGAIAVALVAAGTPACGKKGPPLPPLVKLPAAPGGFVAERRGSSVDILLSLPAANTDGTKPADLDRVDVYGFTGAASASPEEIYRRGARIGTVLVNPPADPDESPEEQTRRRPAVPRGLDQGAAARLKEDLVGPVLEPGMARSYVGVGINKRGRRGPLSKQTAVPLVEPPPPPPEPMVRYDETEITLTWTSAVEPASKETHQYRIYDPTKPDAPLTDRPLSDPQFVDRRIEWGAERCYAVRAVRTVETLQVESDLSPSACVKLIDTFAPSAPGGLTAVAAQGAISLLWEASGAPDLAGYLVFRAIAPATALTQLTPAPIQETTFTDQVMPGARVTYAVQAIDKAGNASPLSARIEETAR
jgi:hypothetical protein